MMNGYYNQNPYNNFVPGCYQQPSQIAGKYVNDFQMVTVNDVSMNGQPSVFVKNDLSEIELRQWSNNGTINSLKFVPKNEQANIPTLEKEKHEFGTNDNVKKVLDEINHRLDSIEKLFSTKGVEKYELSVPDNSKSYE